MTTEVRKIRVSALTAAIMLMLPGIIAARLARVDLGVLPGDTISLASGINDRGDVVGSSCNPRAGLDAGAHCRAFLWSSGRMIDLGALVDAATFAPDLAFHTDAYAINDRGQVVGAGCVRPGDEEPDENCVTHAFLWEHGVMQDLGTLPGGTGSAALAINNRGEIVGASGTAAGGPSHAFLWQNGTMIDLGTLTGSMSSVARAINERGQAVGESDFLVDVFTSRAVLWDRGAMIDLGTISGLGESRATAINNRGLIVINTGSIYSGPFGAFVWHRGRTVPVGPLPHAGSTTFGAAINERGEVAGTSFGVSHPSHGFVWDAGAIVDLGPDTTAAAINNRGQVVGNVVIDGQSHAVLWEKRPAKRHDR